MLSAAKTMNVPQVAQSLDNTCGAACFESMFRFFRGLSPGEMHFANALGTLKLGYTPPENIVQLALVYGFDCTLLERACVADIERMLRRDEVVFVIWWDEDAGHYSLVREINSRQIVLMDPWLARESKDNVLKLDEFQKVWAMRGNKLICVGKKT